MDIQEKTLDVTRTLLIIGFKNVDEYNNYAKNKLPLNQIVEYYTVLRTNFLFVFFYDLRDAIKFYKGFNENGLTIRYTIAKYEISRKLEECTEKNYQSTINIFFKNTNMNINDSQIINIVKVYGDIRELKNSKPNQKIVMFYNIQDARRAFKNLNDSKFEDGIIKCRWVWDLSIYQRSEYLAKTDELLKGIGGLIREPKEEPITKKMKIGKVISNENILINLFDKFIIENLELIEKFFKNQD